ncbi:MAG: DHH family phosphoesterase [Candidatus Thorarchaeota archaeon]|nr:DHH family phosphoesterase [Candidatus Thorarchaeota archaeon]
MMLRELLRDTADILVVGHQNADPDAVASMVAFARLYRAVNATGKVTLASDDVSRIATKVLQTFAPDAVVLDSVDGEFDLVVMLDTNSPIQLGPSMCGVLRDPERTLIIDHHIEATNLASVASHSIVNSDRSSTCEIVAGLYEEMGVEMSPDTASLLLAGILFDSRRFLYADGRTLEVALRLIAAGADYQKCMSSLVSRPDKSERIARLKAVARMKSYYLGDWIVVTSVVNAFEASTCRAMIELGADVAIVGGKPSKDLVRLSCRCTNEFHEATGISMARDVMEPQVRPLVGRVAATPMLRALMAPRTLSWPSQEPSS